jgi:hypothetical protein
MLRASAGLIPWKTGFIPERQERKKGSVLVFCVDDQFAVADIIIFHFVMQKNCPWYPTH